ncbi:MAG: hypothetical protein R2807_08270 [Chitinophagales bacterium]
MLLSFFQMEEGVSFFSNILNLIHLHLLFAVLFLISYSIKSILFLTGKKEQFLNYKKKTILIETLFSIGFLVFGFWVFMFHIKSGAYASMHWLDPKITLAILGIPLGIVGFKKENKKLVGLSLAFFLVALIIGLLHYR